MAGLWLSGSDEGPVIGVPGVRNRRLRMNSGVSTSSGLLETEELVEERREAGLGVGLEWSDQLSGEAGVGGESSGRR